MTVNQAIRSLLMWSPSRKRGFAFGHQDVTVKECVDLFLRWKSVSKSPGTVMRYKNILYKLVDLHGEKVMASLVEDDLFVFINQVKDRYKIGFVFNILTVVKMFIRYNYPIRTYIHPDNIELERPDHVVEYTTEEDVDYLCAFVSERDFVGLRSIALVKMLHYSGMRVSELLALNIEDIDKMPQEAKVMSRKKRGKQVERPVRWSKEADEALHEYIELRQIKDFEKDTNALFVNKYGERLSVRAVERTFADLCKISEIGRKITPHTCRHGFGHFLGNHNATGKQIGEALGHSKFNPMSGLHYIRMDFTETLNILRFFVK